MAKILICMAPEPGHLVPALSLGQELHLRGHRVALLTSEHFSRVLSGFGFELLPWLAAAPDFAVGACDDLFAPTLAAEGAYCLAAAGGRPLAGSIASAVGTAARDVAADLILVDAIILGRFAPPLADYPPVLAVSPALADLGPVRLGRPQLVLCPRELDLARNRWVRSPEVCYGGPSLLLDRPEPMFPWERLEARHPLVYCTLGTQSANYPSVRQHLQAILAAAAGLPGVDFAVHVGNYSGSADLIEAADRQRNVVAVHSAPQLALLRRAAVTVCHAGLGTVKECIWHGVPMVAVPCMTDQPGNAARIVEHRLGMAVPWGQATAAAIRGAVAGLLGAANPAPGMPEMQQLFRARQKRPIAAEFCEQNLGAALHQPAEVGGISC